MCRPICVCGRHTHTYAVSKLILRNCGVSALYNITSILHILIQYTYRYRYTVCQLFSVNLFALVTVDTAVSDSLKMIYNGGGVLSNTQDAITSGVASSGVSSSRILHIRSLSGCRHLPLARYIIPHCSSARNNFLLRWNSQRGIVLQVGG